MFNRILCWGGCGGNDTVICPGEGEFGYGSKLYICIFPLIQQTQLQESIPKIHWQIKKKMDAWLFIVRTVRGTYSKKDEKQPRELTE